MNRFYILLLVLWTAFNSSDAWYYTEPPRSTTAQPSRTAQPNDTSNPHYQTQTQAPYWRRPYYWMPTQAPYWRRPYYQMPTQSPYWRRPYYQMPTQSPYWRRPYYQMTTQSPYRRRPYYQMPTQSPYRRRPYYQMTTQSPYWRRPYYQMPTQAPYWRTPYYQMTTQSPYRRRPYYQMPTQSPYWRRPYYQMPTQAPYWRRPYYQMPTQSPYRRRPYYQMPTQAPYRRRPYYQMPTQSPYRRRPYYQMPTSYWRIQDAPVPNITVFRQMQDRDHVIVMCSFGRRFTESSFQLSVEGEHRYTLKIPLCYSDEKCVFDVKVSTPVSFTCVHEINSAVNRRSETYTYSPSAQPTDMRNPYYQMENFSAVLDQHEKRESSVYIGFFSFIVVGLFAMTAAVIIATLKFKSIAKGPKITGAANDYTDE